MCDVLSICRKSGASSVFAIMRGRWCCTTHPGGPKSRVLRRREPVLGHQEIVLAVWCDEEEARDHDLALTSPEPAWAEVRLFVPQDLLRRRGKIPECALDVWRAVGGLRRRCE